MRPSKTFAIVATASVVMLSTPVLARESCTSDDGSGPVGCIWNAASQGNREGVSFISDVAYTPALNVEAVAQRTIAQLTREFPDVAVYWTFTPDTTEQNWGVTYCTNTAADNTPVVVIDNDPSHFSDVTAEQDIATVVRHEFGHVLMCNANVPQDEATADAIAQLLTPSNEMRSVYYVLNSEITPQQWSVARKVTR